MGKTLFQKIWDAHTVGILPDGRTQMFIATHLLHEVTSPQAFGMVRDLGLTVRHPERTFATVDHIIPTDNQAEPFADATFLEHVRAKTDDGPVTKYNGLFHWTVPSGMEIRAGAECGRHICMTHCYWRTGGDVFGGAQIMGVVHGLEKDAVLEHKAAIDRHLEASGIPILHTAVFWGERSEIKPSEISPELYRKWMEEVKKAPVLQ